MDKELKQSIRESISNLSKKQKVRAAHMLNNWEFPDELKEYEPLDWNSIPNHLPKSGTGVRNKFEDEVFRFLIDEIKSVTTEKERFRYLHIVALHCTVWEFEKWWISRRIKRLFRTGFGYL